MAQFRVAATVTVDGFMWVEADSVEMAERVFDAKTDREILAEMEHEVVNANQGSEEIEEAQEYSEPGDEDIAEQAPETIKMTVREFIKAGHHLPEALEDFQDQKDVFKALFDLWGESDWLKYNEITWIDVHIFTIDFFLQYMGMHGYKLQHAPDSRVDEFYDLPDTITQYKKRLDDMFYKVINGDRTKDDQPRRSEADQRVPEEVLPQGERVLHDGTGDVPERLPT